MRTGMHRRAAVLTALFLAIVTLAMALMSANSGHDWGDDFAGYISQAIAIAQGTLEQQAHINLVTHPSDLSFLPAGADSLVYVWGLSLMLVPVYWLFGYDTDSFSSIIYYKLPGILCLAGRCCALSRWFSARKSSPPFPKSPPIFRCFFLSCCRCCSHSCFSIRLTGLRPGERFFPSRWA